MRPVTPKQKAKQLWQKNSRTKKFSLSRTRTAVRAIQQPVKAATRESTVAQQDAHSGRVFTASVLTAATRQTTATTKADSVRKVSALVCRVQTARSREATGHARTATEATTTAVAIRTARSRGATGHATTTTVTKAATNHGRADITTAAAITTGRSREVTVLVTTTTKTVTSNSLTAHATMPETVPRARKTMAIRQTREVISRGTEVTSHAAATRTGEVTTTEEVTIMEAIRTGEVTTTVAATRTAAATIRAVIASVQLIMTRMQNTRSRSGLSTRRRTSTRTSRSA